MKKFDFKKILPHIIAVVIFLIVSVIYCKPALEGKVVLQPDIQGWRGMAQQSMEFHDKEGYYPLWTNSMFSGMPAYQIAFDARTKMQVGYLDSVIKLGLPKPISFFFLACICFYFLCVVAGANPWIGVMGALSYAYCSFNGVIVAVGHDSQMFSIGYAPAVLAGLLLLFRKHYWTGFAVTAFFSLMLIGQNHIQIVYYTLIMAGFMTIAFCIKSFREKLLRDALKAAGLGLLAALLGLAANAVTMLPTYDYAKESTRGGRSELTTTESAKNNTKGGLNKEEAFRWSYGFGETFTFILADLYGGGSGNTQLDENSDFAQKLAEIGAAPETAAQYANASAYWGDQPSTAGPVYLGAIVCFLFIFGLFYVKGWQKWWMLAASLFGIMLAWGANLQGINYFLFDHMPLYNKFRAVTMSLVIPQLCFSFLGVLAVEKLIRETDLSIAKKSLKNAVYLTGAIILFLAAFYFTASFSGPNDSQLKDNFKQSMLQQIPQGQQAPPQLEQKAEAFSSQLISSLHDDRQSMMGGDLMKSIILIGLAGLFIWLFVRKKINPLLLSVALILLTTIDLLNTSSRYLNASKFVEDTDFESVFAPSPADQQILNDPDHNKFRVFNQTASNPFYSDSRTSYHHNSIGGYHPAMLGLYNDIITEQLAKGNMEVYNMLNTKYIIVQNPQTGQPSAQLNPGALGNAWFVKGIRFVPDANAEMAALNNTNLGDTAIVEEIFKSKIPSNLGADSSASITMTENLNDVVKYTYRAASPRFAVLSEVYYPAGWNAYLDGKKVDYVKTNYVLRGLALPAGNHNLEFRFEPKSFTTGRTITIIANILVLLSMIAAVIFYFKRRPEPNKHLL